MALNPVGLSPAPGSVTLFYWVSQKVRSGFHHLTEKPKQAFFGQYDIYLLKQANPEPTYLAPTIYQALFWALYKEYLTFNFQ